MPLAIWEEIAFWVRRRRAEGLQGWRELIGRLRSLPWRSPMTPPCMFHGGERMACCPRNQTFRFLEGKVMQSPPSSPQSFQPNSHSNCSRVGMTQNALTEVAGAPAAGSHLPCCLRALFRRADSLCPCLARRILRPSQPPRNALGCGPNGIHHCAITFLSSAEIGHALATGEESARPLCRQRIHSSLDFPAPWLHAEKARHRAVPSFHLMLPANFGLSPARWMQDYPGHSWGDHALTLALPVPG